MESIQNNCLYRFDLEYSGDAANILKVFICCSGMKVSRDFIVMVRFLELFEAMNGRSKKTFPVDNRFGSCNQNKESEFDMKYFLAQCLENVSTERRSYVKSMADMMQQYESMKDMMELFSVMKEFFPDDTDNKENSNKKDENQSKSPWNQKQMESMLDLFSDQIDDNQLNMLKTMFEAMQNS